uniref:Uncharacterized protein n=1 Tax=Anguilla anguilla TaxID=7936 RepID=A0A0E9QRY9_ANGAN
MRHKLLGSDSKTKRTELKKGKELSRGLSDFLKNKWA